MLFVFSAFYCLVVLNWMRIEICLHYIFSYWFSANMRNIWLCTLIKCFPNKIKTQSNNTYHEISLIFSSLCRRQCELLPSLGVRHLSSINFSHFNLVLWNPSAKWSETWKVLSKDCSFCPDPITNIAAIGNSCFWLANLKKKSSPLKPLGQMDRNLVGSILGRSFIKIAHLVPIH